MANQVYSQAVSPVYGTASRLICVQALCSVYPLLTMEPVVALVYWRMIRHWVSASSTLHRWKVKNGLMKLLVEKTSRFVREPSGMLAL